MKIRRVKTYVDPIDKYFGNVKQETKDQTPKPEKQKKKVIRRKLSDFPRFASEFMTERNGIKPEDIASMSHTRYWWKCSQCGHEWQTSCNNRVYGATRCPKCVKQRISNRNINK